MKLIFLDTVGNGSVCQGWEQIWEFVYRCVKFTLCGCVFSLQAGLDPISESTVKVKESDEMETKEKKKKRKKNRVQRVFAWMRKTFSCLSCNRNVMGWSSGEGFLSIWRCGHHISRCVTTRGAAAYWEKGREAGVFTRKTTALIQFESIIENTTSVHVEFACSPRDSVGFLRVLRFLPTFQRHAARVNLDTLNCKMKVQKKKYILVVFSTAYHHWLYQWPYYGCTHGGSVVSTVASQQKVLSLNQGPLPVCVEFTFVTQWVSSGCSGFFPHSTDMPLG